MTTVPLGALTDAELVVLSRPGTLPLLPAWSRLAPAEQPVVREAARRSLVARGLLDPDVEGRAGVSCDLRSVLTLREAAGGVVAVARASSRGRDQWYAHAVADVVLVEQAGDDGVHRFALASSAALDDLLAAAVLHPDAIAAAGPSPVLEADWVRADVVACRVAAEPDRCALLSGPGGTWRLRGDRAEEHAAPWSPEEAHDHLLRMTADWTDDAPRVSRSAAAG